MAAASEDFLHFQDHLDYLNVDGHVQYLVCDRQNQPIPAVRDGRRVETKDILKNNVDEPGSV